MAALVAGAAGAVAGDGWSWAFSTALVCLMMWVVVSVVAWVVGWPVGLVVERLLEARGVEPGARVVVLAGVGGAMAVVAAAPLGLWTMPGLVVVLVGVGAVGAGCGRAAVIARDLPPVSEGRGTLTG